MKFFNWVHKRLHHTLPKDHDDLADDNNNIKAEKSHVITEGDQELVQADMVKQALLKKTILVDALDGWKDGILAIGTFGFDPLKPLIGNPYFVLHSEEDEVDTPDFSSDEDNEDDSEDDSEEDEVNPLMFTSLRNSFKDDDGCIIVDEESLSVADDKKNLGRTTLADLFLADVDQADIKKKMMMGKLGIAVDDFDDIKHTKKMNLLKAKRGLSFAKKLIPKVKDEASPIKNIQRLMRRMMKRKIHPELLDAKSQKSDGQMAATALELTPIKSASLLA